MIELHQGKIKVESVPGEGSIFSFTLKTAALDEVANKFDEKSTISMDLEQNYIQLPTDLMEKATTELNSSTSLATLLIVDDEPIVHQVIKLHLAAKNYHILSAANGPQVMSMLKSNNVDLVLLDVMMRPKNGYEVCRFIRQTSSREELPVIFLSAKDRPKNLLASIDAGGNDYIIKPITRNELIVRIETQLELLSQYRHKQNEFETNPDKVPICAWCKNIRDNDGCWNQLEVYFHNHTDLQLSHGICPDCIKDQQAKIKEISSL